MSEAESFPVPSRASFETSAVEFAPDLSDREFLTEDEKRQLVVKVQLGLEAQELLKDENNESVEVELEAAVKEGREAEELMVKTHFRLARKIANAHFGSTLTWEDLLQHAQIGLLNAVRTFDLASDVEFKDYASSNIRKAVRKSIANTDRLIDLPENDFWLVRGIPAAEDRFKQENGRFPTDEELAGILNAKVSKIVDLRPMAKDAIAVLDAPLGDDDSVTLKDRLTNNDTAEGIAQVEKISNPHLRAALEQLPDEKRKFLLMQYGLEEYPSMHPEDIADEMGISPKSVPRTGSRIHHHLRVIMDSDMGEIPNANDTEDLDIQISTEKREYDPFASPLLDVRDGPWLTALMKKPPATEFFQRANELIMTGSDDLTGRYQRPGGKDLDEVVAANLSARQQFFTDLGFTNPQHPLYESFQTEIAQPKRRSLPKLSNFVLTQRAFFLHGVHPVQIIQANPNSLFYSPDFVVSHLQTLSELGVNVGKVVKNQPGVLKLNTQRLHSTASALADEGLDIKRTLESDPWLFMTAPEELTERVANIRNLGFDARKIILRCPNVLDFNAEALNQKLADWQEMGLSPTHTLPRAPELISFNTDTLRKKVAAFKQLSPDVDWDTLIQRQPKILQSNVDKVGRRIRLLQRLGRTLKWEGDVNELIFEKPAILADAQSKLLFLARVAVEKLNQDARQLTAKQVKDATIIPVDSHLFATSRASEPYSPNLARRYSTGKTPEERRSMAERALRDTVSAQRIGAKVIRAYNRHITPKK